MNPTAQLLEPEVRELVEEGRYSELRAILHELPHADVADIFKELDPDKAAVAFRFLLRDDAADVFSYLEPEFQEELIEKLGAEGALRIVEAMSPDDRAALLDELPPEVAQRLIASLSPEERRITQAILGYPEESVGRLMTPDYVSLKSSWTIGQALDHIRKVGRDAETINVVYVVDDRGVLIDDLKLRHILLADPAASVDSIMNHQFESLRADQDQEEAVRLMARYDRIALPVIDSRGVLVGIVTADDVADVAEAEVTEDIQQIGGLSALDEPYMSAGLLEMVKKRGLWLAVIFGAQTATLLVLGAFHDTLERAAILAVFMPLIISTGGNTGSQSATLIIRALALEQIKPGNWIRVAIKETITGLLMGLALGSLGAVCALVWHFAGPRPIDFPLHLAATVWVTITLVVLWGSLAGALLPILLRTLKFDPAVASSPMVATIMDASGMMIYFTVAVLILTGAIL